MIFFLYGEDTYRSHENLLVLKDQLMLKHQNSADVFSFDFEGGSQKQDTLSALFQSLETMTLFSEGKIVIVKRIFSSNAGILENMELFSVQNLPLISQDKNKELVFWDEKVDKRKKFFKLLQKHAHQCEEFSPLSGNQLEKWIIQRAARYGKKIPKQAVTLISNHLSNTAIIDSELMKAANLSESDTITEQELKSIVESSIQNTIFEALDAIGSGDKKRAFSLFTDRIQKGDNPLYLLSMCAYQMRSLLRVISCTEEGMHIPGVIAKELSIHPFVASKLVSQASKFSKARALRAFQFLARMDIAAKTGKIDSVLAIEEWIIKF